jgi:hypothetical protein
VLWFILRIAQTAAPEPTYLTLVNYGVLGILVVLLISGVLYSRWTMDRELKIRDDMIERLTRERDDAIGYARQQDRLVLSEVTPALKESTALNASATDALTRAVIALDRIERGGH